MKKIITLSIVCLVSSQLFAQSDATAKKVQIEAQKQKETSSMSLKQATDAKVIPAAEVAKPVVSVKAGAKQVTAAPVVAAKADASLVAPSLPVVPVDAISSQVKPVEKATAAQVKKEK